MLIPGVIFLSNQQEYVVRLIGHASIHTPRRRGSASRDIELHEPGCFILSTIKVKYLDFLKCVTYFYDAHFSILQTFSMSGLETLGLVCNILQVISFAHETVTLCAAIYDGKHPDDHLKENAAQISALSADVEKHYASVKKASTPHEKRLAEVAHKCNIAARALEEEILFLTGHQAKGNLAATIKTAVKTNWRKKRLQKLELSLQTCRDTMESHILVHMS